MKVGDKIRAKWSEIFLDCVTKDKVYEVVEVAEFGFWIINDKGQKVFPVATSFSRVFE